MRLIEVDAAGLRVCLVVLQREGKRQFTSEIVRKSLS